MKAISILPNEVTSQRLVDSIDIITKDYAGHQITPAMVAAALIGDALQENAKMLATEPCFASAPTTFGDKKPSGVNTRPAHVEETYGAKQNASMFPETDAVITAASYRAGLCRVARSSANLKNTNTVALKVAVCNLRSTLFGSTSKTSIASIAATRMSIVTNALAIILKRDNVDVEQIPLLKEIAKHTRDTQAVTEPLLASVLAQNFEQVQHSHLDPKCVRGKVRSVSGSPALNNG